MKNFVVHSSKCKYRDQVKGMRCARNVSRMGDKMNAYKVLEGKPEGKRPLGRPKRI
jgi:hypothetical protein